MLLLLDPSIKSDLVQWQHMRIIKSLLYQNSSKLALKYMRIKRLPLQTPEDVKLRLTVLLANGLTAEAYEYQKVCRDQLSGDDLLSHLFLACHQSKKIVEMIICVSGVRRVACFLASKEKTSCLEFCQTVTFLCRGTFSPRLRAMQNNEIRCTFLPLN